MIWLHIMLCHTQEKACSTDWRISLCTRISQPYSPRRTSGVGEHAPIFRNSTPNINHHTNCSIHARCPCGVRVNLSARRYTNSSDTSPTSWFPHHQRERDDILQLEVVNVPVCPLGTQNPHIPVGLFVASWQINTHGNPRSTIK